MPYLDGLVRKPERYSRDEPSMLGAVLGQTQWQHELCNLPEKTPRKGPKYLVSGQKQDACKGRKTSALPDLGVELGVEGGLTLWG